MKNTIYLLILLIATQISAQNTIIPTPVSYEPTDSFFELGSQINFNIKFKDSQVKVYSENFKDFLKKSGITINDNKNKKDNSIIIKKLKNKSLKVGNEGYLLEIKNHTIEISATNASGVFNGFKSLQQLIKTELLNNNLPLKLKGCKIFDSPRFAWRGLMLDVSRHFFSVADVKAYIDKMSEYKFNVFHWHLTDDEGWRIEIKSLPKLTDVGAWRVERYGRFGTDRVYPKKDEKATYGGFYTQEQIKEVIKYASDRNITIVPEIDVPGHSMAALAAYPELSVNKEPKFVNPGAKFAQWDDNGHFKMLIENTLNPTDENVYIFLDKIFTEVAALFPGKYIHMGGDEAYHGYWTEDPVIQSFMKKNNLKNASALQSYFVKRIEKIISSKGKKLIGWDEILQGGLAKGATVMSWRGMKGGIEAAKMGHKVVMSPTTYAYLDYAQGDLSVENQIYANLSLEKAYSFEPVPTGVDSKYILGGQANLWTEVVPTLSYAYYMAYPRAFAIAETVWSPKEKKNWSSFIGRVENQFKIFDTENTNISKAVLDPIIKIYKEQGKIMCQLKNNVPNTSIYYTIDNTYPVKFGVKYTEPFEIPTGKLSLRTQTFRNDKPLGRVLLIPRTDLVKRISK